MARDPRSVQSPTTMTPTLSALDITVVVVYLGGVVAMSYVLARQQHTGEDYFLAGRSMRAAPLAISILANQASAVSLVGAPAFVALREGGGFRWLQYELAVPLAMLVLIVVFLPALRSVPGSSIYAYAEQRFGRADSSGTRWQLSRLTRAVPRRDPVRVRARRHHGARLADRLVDSRGRHLLGRVHQSRWACRGHLERRRAVRFALGWDTRGRRVPVRGSAGASWSTPSRSSARSRSF